MILAVGITLFSCFAEPSFRAILPELLTKNKLQEGNALLDSVQRGAGILAPASLGFVLKLTTEIHLWIYNRYSRSCSIYHVCFFRSV